MTQLLLDNPLLLLFVVAALSYPLGRVHVKGISLGVAAALFVGLAIGSLHPDMRLPEEIYELGLVIFVYSIGLSSGPQFFASFRRGGLRHNLFIVGMLLVAALLVILVRSLLGLRVTVAAGLFTGSMTNTPSLAGVLEYIRGVASPELLDQMLAEPVVGYSVAYPMGVLGMILTIALVQRLFKVDYRAEAEKLRDLYNMDQRLSNRTICVTNPAVTDETIKSLATRHGWDVLFGRMRRAGQLSLATGQTRFMVGDLVTLIGSPEDLDAVTAYLGEETAEDLEMDRKDMDFRRIFVSNPKVAGHRLRDLNLPQQFGAIVTRIRRGDVEMLAHGDTELELGDRVRVVTKRENMEAVSKFFGDSYRALSEIDILTFSLGLSVGVLLGLVPFPLPGGAVFRLGFAGGPLIVALILGTLGRTGPLVWNLPYSANLTLRQIGLLFFLAGVGTRSGYAFVNTLQQGGGLQLFIAGAFVTCSVGLLTLWIGYKLLNIPMGILIGMLAALQTQPAVLAFAHEQAESDLPSIGYATVYPIATITKILLAQLLVIFLQ
jgi:putative transport protein